MHTVTKILHRMPCLNRRLVMKCWLPALFYHQHQVPYAESLQALIFTWYMGTLHSWQHVLCCFISTYTYCRSGVCNGDPGCPADFSSNFRTSKLVTPAVDHWCLAYSLCLLKHYKLKVMLELPWLFSFSKGVKKDFMLIDDQSCVLMINITCHVLFF